MTLDAQSCAALLHCSKSHLHRLARAGEIPATKVGRGWVFVEAEIMSWLSHRTLPKIQVETKKVGRPRKIVA